MAEPDLALSIVDDNILAAADEMRDALIEWFAAKDAREAQPVPFGATPETHIHIFEKHLIRARTTTERMEKALNAYRVIRERKSNATP